MRKYISAELYRNLNRAYYRNFVGIVAILSVALNVIWKVSGLGYDFSMGFKQMGGFLSMGTAFVLLFVDMVTTEEYKNDTMKNVVSSGLSRDKIVLGKMIATIILALLALVIILTIFFGSGYLLLEKLPMKELKPIVLEGILKVINAIPVWIAFSVIHTFTSLNLRSSISSIIGYYGIISIIPSVLGLISMMLQKTNWVIFFDRIALNKALSTLSSSQSGIVWQPIQLSLIYIVVFTALSIITFRKKDI